MKTDMSEKMTRDEIYGFEALYDSYLKCRKGKTWKKEVAYFCVNDIEETYKLSEQLLSYTYKPRKPKRFTLLYPKRREIVANAFRDRVRQRSLNDNLLYPLLTRSFIPTNFACQKDKGVDVAREYFYDSLRSYGVNHANNFYVLKIDIKSYYASLNHDIVNAKLKKKLPKWAYEETVEILEEQYEGDRGYNPGSQMVQLVGISFLDGLDHYIKEKMHIKRYARYMDDLVLIHDDKEYLKKCLKENEAILTELDLTMHPKKTRIYCMRNEHVDFLGFRYKVDKNGRIIVNVLKSNVKHYKKKLRKLVKKARTGEMEREEVDACYQAWKAHVVKGKHYKLLCMMDKYYKDLWRDDNVITQEIKNIDRSSKATGKLTCRK